MDELRLKLLWSNLFGLRFMLTILPQNTFISEEEFTESPGKMAGPILGLDTITFPTQQTADSRENMLFPLFSSGIPYVALRALRDTGLQKEIVSPYMVLVMPRIWATVISMLTDIYIYKIAINCGWSVKEGTTAMVLFASCYLTWVFFTRTYSAGIEAFVYAVMLYVITKDAKPQTQTRTGEVVFTRTTVFTDAFQLAASLVIGISCNSLFVAFGLFPIMYWVLKPLRSLPADAAVYRIVVGGICFITSVFFCSLLVKLCNQLYHDPSILSHMLQEFDVNQFIMWASEPFTPFSTSGIKFEHLAMIPLNCFAMLLVVLIACGPLAVMSCKNVTKIGQSGTYGCSVLIFSVISTLCAGVVVTIPSPMALIAIIVPLAILSAKQSMGKSAVIFWFAYNIVGFLILGIEMQAGVIPSVEFLHSVAQVHSRYVHTPRDLHLSAVYYKTPVPSRHLAAWTNPTMESDIQEYPKRHASLYFMDGDGGDIQFLLDKLLLIEPEITVFLIMPAAVPCSLIFKLRMMYDLELFRQFFPHVLHGEVMPNYYSEDEWCTSNGEQHTDIPTLLFDKLSLNLYKVERTRKGVEQQTDTPEIASKAEGVKLVLNNYSSAM